MKRFFMILLSILCIIGLQTNVNAASYYAPNSVTVSNNNDRYEFISGLPIYHLTAGGYELYPLSYNTNYGNRTTLTDPRPVDGGFAYIINNSDVTSSTIQNYYIASVAVLWYQDYLNGNDYNISYSLKNYISNHTSDSICNYVYRLVNNAKNYSYNQQNIRFLDNDVTFTRNGSYYYSNVISVETYNLNKKPNIKFYNAPTGTTLVNDTTVSSGRGTFQIRIPESSIRNYNDVYFTVYLTAEGLGNTVYKYSNYGYGEAIYGRSYSDSSDEIEASLPIIFRSISDSRVRINILDINGNYISGLSYAIYSGDCKSGTCYSNNLVHSFTTRSTYIELNNILSSGTYTLVSKSNASGYSLPSKSTFVVNNATSVQDVTIRENSSYNNYNNNNNNYYYDYDNDYYYDNGYNNRYNNGIRSRKVNIYNNINDSKDIIKIYSISNVLQTSYRSNNTNYEINLTEGLYYLFDTENKINKIYFRITDEGDLEVKYDDNGYIKANYINLDYKNNNSIIVDDVDDDRITKKYDEETNTYYIDGLDGISSIEITNDISTDTDVKIEWLSNIIDCPITSLNATVKYIIGAIVLSSGIYLVFKNVKKNKNNI